LVLASTYHLEHLLRRHDGDAGPRATAVAYSGPATEMGAAQF
jgi:hypothetical protein